MNDIPKPLLNQGKFAFLTLIGSGLEKDAGKMFPWWRRSINWIWARLRGRRAYQVAPALWRSDKVVTLQPEIYDYNPEEEDREDET